MCIEYKLMEYKLNSDEEPTDAQLAWLMSEVSKDVKIRADKANSYFIENLLQMTEMAIKKRHVANMVNDEG